MLRCHPPPNMHKMNELSSTAAELGFAIDASGAGPLQASLQALRAGMGADTAALEVLTLLATKPMQVRVCFAGLLGCALLGCAEPCLRWHVLTR